MKWLEPWHPIDNSDDAQIFETQLQKELPSDHALSGKQLRAVGRRYDQDGVLFLIVGESSVAEVYLDWLSAPVHNSELPFARLYPDEDTWVETGLRRANAQWRD